MILTTAAGQEQKCSTQEKNWPRGHDRAAEGKPVRAWQLHAGERSIVWRLDDGLRALLVGCHPDDNKSSNGSERLRIWPQSPQTHLQFQ